MKCVQLMLSGVKHIVHLNDTICTLWLRWEKIMKKKTALCLSLCSHMENMPD